MRYSFVSAIWLSFYSGPFYHAIARRWRASALVYLALVLAVFWAPVLVQLHRVITRALTHIQADIIPQIPAMRFEKGHMSTPEARPYLLNFGTAKTPILLIIDTSGKITSLEGRDGQMLVTRDKIYIRQRTGETRIYDLAQSVTKPFVVNQTTIMKIYTPVKRWALVLLYAAMLVGSFIKRLIQAFFIALLGMVLASLIKAELDLGALFTVAIVSMTPVMAVQTFASFMPRPVPHGWILWGMMTAGYFLFAFNAASDQTIDDEGE